MWKKNFKYRLFLVFSIFLLSGVELSAQIPYTLKATIDTALNRNLGIRIERNYLQISKNNATWGNAGILPRVDVGAYAEHRQNSINQKFSDNSVIETSNVQVDNYSADVILTWTLFNGTRMFSDFNQLKLQKDISDLNLKQEVISTVAAVSRVYYELARAQNNIVNIKVDISLYQERMKLAEERMMVGKAAKTEFLQAKVDYNEQLTGLYIAEANLNSSRFRLNELLLFPAEDTSIVAVDSLLPTIDLNYAALWEGIEQNNPDVKEYLLLQEVARQELRSQKSYSMPELDFNAGYAYNSSATTSGFFRENRSNGPMAGLTLKWNLFNGNVQNRQIQNSRLMVDNSKLSAIQLNNSLKTTFVIAWQQYQAALVIWKKELENTQLAEENLSIIMERYRLNYSDVIELREAQRSRENAFDRLLNAAFLAKLAETELLTIAGVLVK